MFPIRSPEVISSQNGSNGEPTEMASVCGVKEQGKPETMRRVLCSDDCLSETVSPHVNTIVQYVDDEFGSKAELFTPIVVRMNARQGAEFEKTKSPGVYVFIDENGDSLKVGKNHLNASKRALEHCKDDTHSKDGTIHMADRDNEKTYLLVFALQKDDSLEEHYSLHWVLALEYFLEKKLKPKIPSLRNG